ncbi:MurR/RpiR family transcriptional regulator [Poseidonocella sedimentorum]|uniref:DNA-binding transcriptional regulator, MurR/RpiR family, contains HTH and SIS domains n=1 Tax=Poseidonocella sedimentorum TaxID=871652 RepID=A0A1I6E4X4_9RHOB|nr:MurR/RpiR family transcriptional regulator [Poseidonocella sedimentorum]SFR12773.1 DNA-binding transcriptional regulator, MurR/RpiR family, contains HTH and SIS domains [Poseidonocella sedimentorum]
MARIVKELIRAQAPNLTPAERQLADVLLRDYPAAGLQSVTRIAEAGKVSTPTVIRLARKLGFDGFTELQVALREEVSARMRTPIVKREAWPESAGATHPLHRFAEAVFDNLDETVARLDPVEFSAIAALLADPARALTLCGGRITRSNADYFFNHLQIIRPKVALLPPSTNVWPQYLLDIGPTSVVVLFDIRRYETELARLASAAKSEGATLVLFTDQWGSPIAESADHVVNASVEVPSSWDSTLALNLVIEALVAEVQALIWPDARDRIERLEALFQSARIFRKPV